MLLTIVDGSARSNPVDMNEPFIVNLFDDLRIFLDLYDIIM